MASIGKMCKLDKNASTEKHICVSVLCGAVTKYTVMALSS